jgi:hypothetical protein
MEWHWRMGRIRFVTFKIYFKHKMPILELPLSYHELEEQRKKEQKNKNFDFACIFVLFLLLVIFIICYYLYTEY